MSAPSVWRAANVKPGKDTTLENIMTAVLLHEATHVAHMPTYGAASARSPSAYHLPEDFNDDSIQKAFKGNDDFAASVEREVEAVVRRRRGANDRAGGNARALRRAR